MADISTNNTSTNNTNDFSFSIQLPAPNAQVAGQFANQDVAKFKVLQGNGQLADAGDTLTSYASIQAGATSLDIKQMTQLGIGLGNAEKLLQQQLNNLQPGDPQIPVLTNEINLINQIVTTGTVPSNTLLNLGINPNSGDIDTISVSASSKPSGVNKFLAGNAFVAFENDFSQMIMMMMKGEAVESQIALKSLQVGFTLAQESSQDVTQGANQRAQQLKVQAWTDIASGAVSIAGSVGSAVCMAGMKAPVDDVDMPEGQEGVEPDVPLVKDEPNTITRTERVYQRDANGEVEVDPDGEPIPKFKQNAQYQNVDAQGRVIPDKNANPAIEGDPKAGEPVPETKVITRKLNSSKADIAYRNQQLQSMSQISTGVASGIASIIKGTQEYYSAQFTMQAAAFDADKVIVDAIMKNVQEQQQKALEMIKTNQDNIEQIVQALKSWFDSLSQALQASIRRSS
jgi:hypothetical protein